MVGLAWTVPSLYKPVDSRSERWRRKRFRVAKSPATPSSNSSSRFASSTMASMLLVHSVPIKNAIPRSSCHSRNRSTYSLPGSSMAGPATIKFESESCISAKHRACPSSVSLVASSLPKCTWDVAYQVSFCLRFEAHHVGARLCPRFVFSQLSSPPTESTPAS